MTGFNMPPGCSVRDIPGYDAPDPSPESERVCELLDAEPVTSDEARDEIVSLVDRLVEERDSFRCLLSQALKVLPVDPELQCICNAADALSHCPVHDGTDPTLRQEIQAALIATCNHRNAIYHCNICGGDVSFPKDMKAPTCRIGPGNPGGHSQSSKGVGK